MKLSPIEAIFRVYLTGFHAFFDSSDKRKRSFSHLAWGEIDSLHGNIFNSSDQKKLSALHQHHWCAGTIQYSGNFDFLAFRHHAIFSHDSQTWISGKNELLALAPEEIFPKKLKTKEFISLFSKIEFLNAVKKAQNYIASGDIYQINLTRALTSQIEEASIDSLLAHYLYLRQFSPCPMGGFFHFPNNSILSFSPESFLEISSNKIISSYPIKGTRPRKSNEIEDAQMLNELTSCAKERAELIMITDLLRNDLGQVCEFGSVHVPELLKPHTFAHVHHLISKIEGKLKSNISPVQAIAACFPGGSITGAPKKRAREIIEELEPTPRGIYTGAIGWLAPDQSAEFNIVIRSLIADRNQKTLTANVGAGIISDSIPEKEYEETCVKFRGLNPE